MPQHHRYHYEALLSNFKNKTNVQRAFARFEVIQNDENRLARYLRHHKEEEIKTDDEVYFRDDMDFLIGFDSIMMLALLCGYISFDNLDELSHTERVILNHPAVRRYYEYNYPLVLPVLLRLTINDPGFRSHMEDIAKRNDVGTRDFEKFLSLYRSRLDDEDINNMLFFLDDGYFYDGRLKLNIHIDDFLSVLRNPDGYDKQRSKLLDGVILGFTKYMDYLESYKNWLFEVNNQPYQSAAFWSLECYWFIRLNNKMGNVLRQSLFNLESALGDREELVHNRLNRTNLKLINAWRKESSDMLAQGIKTIDYLKNPELGVPLTAILRTLFPMSDDRPF